MKSTSYLTGMGSNEYKGDKPWSSIPEAGTIWLLTKTLIEDLDEESRKKCLGESHTDHLYGYVGLHAKDEFLHMLKQYGVLTTPNWEFDMSLMHAALSDQKFVYFDRQRVEDLRHHVRDHQTRPFTEPPPEPA